MVDFFWRLQEKDVLLATPSLYICHSNTSVYLCSSIQKKYFISFIFIQPIHASFTHANNILYIQLYQKFPVFNFLFFNLCFLCIIYVFIFSLILKQMFKSNLNLISFKGKLQSKTCIKSFISSETAEQRNLVSEFHSSCFRDNHLVSYYSCS